MNLDTVAIQKRKVGFFLGLGIFLLPPLFVWLLLRKGHSTLSRGLGFAWLAIILLLSVSGGQEGTTKATAVSTAPSPPAYTIPQVQADFIAAVNSAMGLYEQAPNELKKSAVRTNRSNAIAAAMKNNRNINGWVGKITELKTNSEGKAFIAIRLIGSQSEILVKTWNNGLSDIGSNTLISQESPLFSTIADMSEGQAVEFSGTFDSGKDFINESSISESGSMQDPEFIFKFKSIKKI